jgi:hypothetical protein
LVVLPINRRKLARWPDAHTDFFGKDNPIIAGTYANAVSNFGRENYSAFTLTRTTLIQRKVEEFLDLRTISQASGPVTPSSITESSKSESATFASGALAL